MQRPHPSGSRLLVVATLLWAAAPFLVTRPDAAMVAWFPRPGMQCVPSAGPVLHPPSCVSGTCPPSVTATAPDATCDWAWDTCARFDTYDPAGQVVVAYHSAYHPFLGCICTPTGPAVFSGTIHLGC